MSVRVCVHRCEFSCLGKDGGVLACVMARAYGVLLVWLVVLLLLLFVSLFVSK